MVSRTSLACVTKRAFSHTIPVRLTSFLQIATREAKRQNAAYRPHGIRALGNVAKARSDIDMSASVLEIVGPLLQDETDSDAMDVDGETPSAQAAELYVLNALFLEVLFVPRGQGTLLAASRCAVYRLRLQ